MYCRTKPVLRLDTKHISSWWCSIILQAVVICVPNLCGICSSLLLLYSVDVSLYDCLLFELLLLLWLFVLVLLLLFVCCLLVLFLFAVVTNDNGYIHLFIEPYFFKVVMLNVTKTTWTVKKTWSPSAKVCCLYTAFNLGGFKNFTKCCLSFIHLSLCMNGSPEYGFIYRM